MPAPAKPTLDKRRLEVQVNAAFQAVPTSTGALTPEMTDTVAVESVAAFKLRDRRIPDAQLEVRNHKRERKSMSDFDSLKDFKHFTE